MVALDPEHPVQWIEIGPHITLRNFRTLEKIFKLQKGEKHKTGFTIALDFSTVKHLKQEDNGVRSSEFSRK